MAADKQVSAAQKGIVDALKDGDVHKLEVIVKNGASINEHDATKDHFTPLHWACYVGSLEVRLSFVAIAFVPCWLQGHFSDMYS